MKNDDFQNLDISFLPKDLREQFKNNLNLALAGLRKIKWPIKAIVLGGGYKHKEITYNDKKIGSDIDLFIFSNFIPFFWRKLIKIQNQLNKPVHFFHYRGVIPLFLNKSKTFFAYKLKNEGIVLKGDKNILKRIRAKENNIPKIEALRILFQNLVLWLEKGKNNQHFEFLLRSYLNIGEAYLTFFGSLKPSYKERLFEFQKKFKSFSIEKDLAQKIILGYLLKVEPKNIQRIKLELDQAKNDCLRAIDHLLSLYLKSNLDMERKLQLLERKIGRKLIFNLALLFLLKNQKEPKPKILPILFKFKVPTFWRIIFFHETGNFQKRDLLLKKFFDFEKVSEKTIIQIAEFYPFSSLIEI
jgi:hypothetical protein